MNTLERTPLSLGRLLWIHRIHLRDMGLVELLTYVLVGAALFALAMHMRRAGVFRFMIRPPSVRPAQVHREVFNSALSVVLFNGVQLLARVVVLGFGYVVTLDNPIPLWQEVLSFPLVFVAHDAYFYWTHRWMHSPRLFGFFHWEHHKSQAPTAFTASGIANE